MIDKSKTYKTRDGGEVRIYATDGGGLFPVHGAIRTHGGWESTSWTKSGVLYVNDESCVDLIEVRPRHKRTVWLHVFKHTIVAAEGPPLGDITTRIACIKVELDFEEGEGL